MSSTTPLDATTGHGRVPAPRDPAEAAGQALARLALRTPAPVDQITFTAGCPACGADCAWHEERVETRLRIRIGCGCRG